jgi:flagellar FliJ protein
MTQSLQALLQHAQTQRDEALVALQRAEDAAHQLQLQSEQLVVYANEYDARHPARGGRSAPIEVLRCHLGFMQRLQQAQAHQQGLLQAAQARTAKQRQALLALELRVAAVRKLLERRGKDQRQAADQLEQRRHDDAAQQHAWHHRSDMATPR